MGSEQAAVVGSSEEVCDVHGRGEARFQTLSLNA